MRGALSFFFVVGSRECPLAGGSSVCVFHWKGGMLWQFVVMWAGFYKGTAS